jgi:2-oxoglutarate dehydrogenase E2 component (dihydrolipoamide succinyltransferase)
MSVNVTMPQLGESVTEGTVTRWLKNVGDHVTADEPLLEVSTDKVDTEIPAPATGILQEILAPVDATVAVGGMLAVISSDATASIATSPAPAAPVAAEPVAAPVPAPAPVVSAQTSHNGGETPVTLPALGESVTEGVITRWLKNVGDSVAADEALVEVSTDKVDTEIPSPVAGTLIAISAPADSTLAVGGVLGIIASSAPVAATPAPAPTPAAPAPSPAPHPAPVAPTIAAPVVTTAVAPMPVDNSDAYVTPLVRKLAKDNGIDLATIQGTGIGGRLRKQDVMDAVAARSTSSQASAPATSAVSSAAAPVVDTVMRGRTEKLTRLRKVIAQRMVESLEISAQLTSVAEVDVTNIVTMREKMKKSFEAREGVKLSYMPFFAKAIVDTLKSHPVLNCSIDVEAGTVTYHDAEHLAIAVDTEKGLLVPVIRNAGDLSIAGLARHINDLAERTRTGNVAPDELSGGTFTLTNTGSRGALFDTPIINQPQVAILGLGAIVKRPVVVTDAEGRDSIAVRHMVYLSLTYDHRIVDGADAARYLVALKSRLESGHFDI